MCDKYDNFTRAGNRGGALMKLLMFLIIFGAVLTAAWVYFLPTLLTSALQKRTGFGVKVTELRFNPFTAKVDLTGFVINNPESFPQREFISVRSFNANAKMASLFSDRPEFDYAWIEVDYVAFVRDAHGLLNTQLFHERMNPEVAAAERAERAERAAKVKAQKKESIKPDEMVTKGGPAEKPKAEKKPLVKDAKATKDELAAKENGAKAKGKPAPQPIKFLIRRLQVTLDKVIVADYAGNAPNVREFNRKVYYTYNDVTDPKQLLEPFAVKSLESVGTAIRGLIPGDIGKAVGAVTNADKDQLKKPEGLAEDPLKSVVEKLEETPKP